MGNSNSSQKVTAQDRAILDLKLQRDALHQYQKRLGNQSEEYHRVALAHLRKDDRKRALLALRLKKHQESLLSKTDEQLATLEQLVSDVEFSLVQKDIVFGLKQGTEVLKSLRKEIGGLESVEKLMGETQEERRFQEEVSEMLGGIGGLSREEEESVDAELAQLEAETGVRQPERITMPDAPTKNPTVVATLPDTPNAQVDVTTGEEERYAQPLPA